MNNTTQNILLVLACSFIGLLALGIILVVFAFRWLQRLVTPDISAMQRKLEGLRETVEQLGAAAFFEKPYDPIELMAAISRTLEDKKTHPEQQMADR